MAKARYPRYEVVVTPGHGHEDEIYEVERDPRELDLDAADYDERHAQLRAERARSAGAPVHGRQGRAQEDGRLDRAVLGRRWRPT